MTDLIIVDDLSEIEEDEAKQGIPQVDVLEESERLVIIEMRDYTTSGVFAPFPTDKDDTTGRLPIKGRGRLDSVSIAANKNDYKTTVWVDDDKVVNGTWLELDKFSEEYSHLDAYHDDPRTEGAHIVVVRDYPFTEYCNVRIQPKGETEFKLVRVEIVVESRRVQ